jgi:hypothetical protein
MAMVTVDASAAADAATKQPDAPDKEYSSYNGASTTGGGVRARGGVVDSVVARWRREDMLDKSPLALHAAAAAFAFVALVLVASNQHGDWMQFDRYQEYRCVRDPSESGCLPLRSGPRLTCAGLLLLLGTCSRSPRWPSPTRWRRRCGTRTGCGAAPTPSPRRPGGFSISSLIRRVASRSSYLILR